jgi:proteasome lid subunit RPN8/RPN11
VIIVIDLNTQIRQLETFFPGSVKMLGKKIEVWLYPKVAATIDIGKYPKKVEISLPKQISRLIPDFEVLLPPLRNWDKANPPDLSLVLTHLKQSIDMISGIKAYISETLIKTLFTMAAEQLPNEILTLLRLSDGRLTEFIVTPGGQASEISAVFFPDRLARDHTLVASCHSHPSGNKFPSQVDLETFKQKPVNIILARPFNYISIGCYNQLGEPISIEIIPD